MNTVVERYDHTVVTLDDYPEHRFIVFPDNDSNDPIQGSGAPIEFFAYSACFSSAVTDHDGYWINAFKHFQNYVNSKVSTLEVMRRFAHIFHGWTTEEAKDRIITFNHRGYMQGDWLDMLFVVTEDGYGDAQGWAEEWSRWARGDLYSIHTEMRIPCSFENCHADADDDNHWTRENEQGIEFEWSGAIYGDSSESAAQYYAENYL